MSTSASSLNWWYIEGSRRWMYSAGRREAMSRNTPPCGDPRPALISELMARATSSRGSSSGGRRAVFLSSYQRSASSMVSAVAAHAFGDEDSFDRRRPDHAGRVELDELHVHQ